MKTDLVKDTLSNLPELPGVYKYFDKDEIIIYVGKAKNLKKRVSSYFNKIHTDAKTRKLVSLINRIEYVIVNTDFDAYLLENNLIKSFQPKYNILLRDDKTYPYIVITKEPFPRIFSIRNKTIPGQYFGPYSSVKAMNTILDLLKKLYSIRSCNFNLSEKNISTGKFKVCLEYHLGNCKGPCEGLQKEEEYLQEIDQSKIIIKDDLSVASKFFEAEIKNYVQELEFEKAQKTKVKLDWLEKYQSTSVITNPIYGNMEVFTISSEIDVAYINHLTIRYGRIVNGKTTEIRKTIEEEDGDILGRFIFEKIDEIDNKAEIIVNIMPELLPENIKINCVQRGDKKKLVEMSLTNTLFYKKDRIQLIAKREEDNREKRILETMMKDLYLPRLPYHIECFDNSNIQGTSPVAAMVCYKNTKPSKKDWRHYNVKTVVGPDDFASMEEIVFRRYSRLQSENQPMPDLIIIDGGKGQLNAAIHSLEKLGLYGDIPIVSIAKRLEEIYKPNDDIPVYLEKRSETLRLIQKIRDDTHDFGLAFHRNQRSRKVKAEVTELVKKKKAEEKAIAKAEKLKIKELEKLNKVKKSI